MKKIKIFFSISAIAMIIIAACSSGTLEKKQVNEKAVEPVQAKTKFTLPSFAIRDITGKTIDLQSLKGKKVLVNLWAAWCPPCRAEMPSIAALYKKLDKEKTAFVLLSLDQDYQSSINFMKRNKLDLPVYFPVQNLPAIFNTDGIPATFIFDEAGNLIKQNAGADNYDTDEYVQLFK